MKNIGKINIEEAGITLTALVVTIIVILILAGVTVSMVAGDGGIFSKARLAKESYENAALKEAADLNSLDGWLEGKVDVGDGEEDKEEESATSAQIIAMQEEINGLKETMVTMDTTMKTQENTISGLSAQVSTMNNTISDLNTKVDNSSDLLYEGLEQYSFELKNNSTSYQKVGTLTSPEYQNYGSNQKYFLPNCTLYKEKNGYINKVGNSTIKILRSGKYKFEGESFRKGNTSSQWTTNLVYYNYTKSGKDNATAWAQCTEYSTNYTSSNTSMELLMEPGEVICFFGSCYSSSGSVLSYGKYVINVYALM